MNKINIENLRNNMDYFCDNNESAFNYAKIKADYICKIVNDETFNIAFQKYIDNYKDNLGSAIKLQSHLFINMESFFHLIHHIHSIYSDFDILKARINFEKHSDKCVLILSKIQSTDYESNFDDNYLYFSNRKYVSLNGSKRLKKSIKKLIELNGFEFALNTFVNNKICKEFISVNTFIDIVDQESIIYRPTNEFFTVYDINESNPIGQTINRQSIFHCDYKHRYYILNEDNESKETEDNYTVHAAFWEYMYVSDCGEYNFLYEENRNEHDNRQSGNYLSDYHSDSSDVLLFNQTSTLRIGIEIEKEDRQVLRSVKLSKFQDLTNNLYRKESDGSLGNGGFELITPIYELDLPAIIKHIQSNNILLEHINADCSYDTCGAHINVSDESKSIHSLWNGIQNYFPLFYSMYPKRKFNSFCKAKNKEKLLIDNEKYQAFKMHNNRIEFRIFPMLKNFDQLKFRLGLMNLILTNQVNTYKQAKNVIEKKIYPYLLDSKVYDKNTLSVLNQRFIKNSVDYGYSVNIDDSDTDFENQNI
jgi:hypothetical protein